MRHVKFHEYDRKQSVSHCAKLKIRFSIKVFDGRQWTHLSSRKAAIWMGEQNSRDTTKRRGLHIRDYAEMMTNKFVGE